VTLIGIEPCVFELNRWDKLVRGSSGDGRTIRVYGDSIQPGVGAAAVERRGRSAEGYGLCAFKLARRRVLQLHAVLEDGNALPDQGRIRVARHGDQFRVAGCDGDVVRELLAAEVRIRAQRDIRPEGLRGNVEAAYGAVTDRRRVDDSVVAEPEDLSVVRQRQLVGFRPGAVWTRKIWLLSVRNASPFEPQRTRLVAVPMTPPMEISPTAARVFRS
jgi:hypothetical protein